MVKRAGNSCSPVRGSFLVVDDMWDVVCILCVSICRLRKSLVVCECARQNWRWLLACDMARRREGEMKIIHLTVAIPSAAR